MSKKGRRRNKKILAALALAGGAAMLGRGKGAVTGVVNPNAPKSKWVTKKVKDAADTTGSYLSKMGGAGDRATQLANQAKRAALSNTVTDVVPPSELASTARPNRFGTLYKGGGRGTGIAKRGFGRALKKNN